MSESAGQGTPGAWVGKLGLLLFGLGVVRLAAHRRVVWAAGAFAPLLGFGWLLVATAVFSHRPWRPEVPFDPTEDLLHSVAATVMGFLYALGVLVRAAQRRGGTVRVLLDGAAVLSSVLMPLLGLWVPGVAGAAQRAMFGLAFVWFGIEAFRPESGGASEAERRAGRGRPHPL